MDYLERGDKKAALKITERIAKIAVTAAGLRAWHEDGIEVLGAIPEDPRWSREFLGKRLPQIRGFVERKRAVFSAQQARTSKPPAKPNRPAGS